MEKEEGGIMSDREPVTVRVFGQNVHIEIGKRTPDGAPWYEAIAITSFIEPDDSRRIGEEAIRRAVIRAGKRVRRERAALKALPAEEGE